MRKTLYILFFFLCSITAANAQSPAPEGPVMAPYYDTTYIHKQARKYGLDPVKIRKPEIYQGLAEWLGMPYQFGGGSIFGIDCSRFVSLAYEQVFNVKLTGSSRDMFRKVMAVSKDDLQEGDLLFFARKGGGIFHVGMYLSNGKFIHASTSEGVKISSLEEAYYKRHFYKAGRLMESMLESE